MTKFLTRTLLLISTLFTFSAFATDDAISTGFFNNVAIDGYDTVSYFTEGKPVEGNDKFQTMWRDATWKFASQENLNLFKKEPTKYAAQYGGYCAWAMSGGKTAGTDPEVWHIKDGKLYLNYNRKVQVEWFENLEGDIVSADQFYPEITNVKKYQD
jgi:YHS domain-containing protein